MRVLTCYVPGALREETAQALREFALPHMTLVAAEIPLGDSFAYGRTIRALWKAEEDLFIVEPDIVIRQDVVDAALSCGCQYGCFPYAWLTDVGPALGCTWFKADFLRKYRHVLDDAADHISWRQLDVVLMRHILAREYGEQPHVHLPPVEHLNEAKKLLPEANPEPLMSIPHW